MLDLKFDNPSAGFLLILIPGILFLYFQLYQYRKSILENLGTERLLQNILKRPSRFKRGVIVTCLIGSFVFSVIALCQPKGNPHYLLESTLTTRDSAPLKGTITRKKPARLITFLLDSSLSMTVKDTRKGISRFEAGKEIIDNTISKLNGETISVYAFTSELVPIVPPTLDYLFARLMVKSISINEGNSFGTNLADTLHRLELSWKNEPIDMKKTIVILTDGDDSQLADVNPTVVEQVKKSIKEAVEDITQLNAIVITVGIGSTKGGFIPNYQFEGKEIHSRLDETILQSISKKGRGEYYAASEESTIGLATEILARSRDIPVDEETITIPATFITKDVDPLVYELYFKIPLAIAVVLLALSLLINEQKERVV